jgi:hypothetical protein
MIFTTAVDASQSLRHGVIVIRLFLETGKTTSEFEIKGRDHRIPPLLRKDGAPGFESARPQRWDQQNSSDRITRRVGTAPTMSPEYRPVCKLDHRRDKNPRSRLSRLDQRKSVAPAATCDGTSILSRSVPRKHGQLHELLCLLERLLCMGRVLSFPCHKLLRSTVSLLKFGIDFCRLL